MLENARMWPLTTKCLFTKNYHLYFRERTNLLSNSTSGRRTCRSNWHIACKSAMAERKTCQLCEALMEFYPFLASAYWTTQVHASAINLIARIVWFFAWIFGSQQFKPFQVSKVRGKKSATRSLHILVWHHALQDNNVASKQPVLIFLPWTRPVSICWMTNNQMIVGPSGSPLSLKCHILWNPSMLSFHTKVDQLKKILPTQGQCCSHATYVLRFADPSLTSEALRHEDSRSARPIWNGMPCRNSVQIPKYQMDPNGSKWPFQGAHLDMETIRYDNLGNEMTWNEMKTVETWFTQRKEASYRRP